MRLTKERKVYAVILALAGAALAADRLFLGGETLAPGAAVAARVAQEYLPDRSAPTPENQACEQRSQGRTLASRLDALRQDAPPAAPGLFHTSAAWLSAPGAKPAKAAPAPAPEDLRTALARHRITTVVAGGAMSSVIIDGKRLALGKDIEGIYLVGVQKGKAIFERDGERVIIDVEKRESQEPPREKPGDKPDAR